MVKGLISSMACLGLLAGLLMAAPTEKETKTQKQGAPAEKKPAAKKEDGKGPEWKLCMQTWTFHKFTMFESIDKTKALGIKYLEGSLGQPLSPEHHDIEFGHEMSPEYQALVKKKLKEAGVTLVNYALAPLPSDEKDMRKVFEFAKQMGVQTVMTEPDPKTMDTVEKLAEEFKMNVAIHNHPKPSGYWNPDTVLEAVKGRSKRIGACADTGHWLRSGLDPVECLKKLDGRIIMVHFKDLNAKTGDMHDVPWGTGVCNAKAMLTELKRQNFSGVFSVEYEYNWDNSMPEIAQCVEAFTRFAKELGAQTIVAK